MPSPNYCLLPTAYCLRGWVMYPHVIYNSATPTGLGHVSTCYLQFCNPYRVGPGWFPIQRLMPSPNYCLLPTAYCLRGWVMYPHVIYNSATPTGLGYVSTCYLQFCNPYRVGLCIHMSSTILQPLQGWARLVSHPTPDAFAKHYCLLPTAYCLRGWVMYPHVVYNSATPTGLGHVSIHHLQC